MWPLKQTRKNKRKSGPAAARGASKARARRPLISEASSAPSARNIALCVVTGIVLGVGGFFVFSGGAFAGFQGAALSAANDIASVAGLNIARVTVTGRDRASREDLLAAVGAEQGTPILAFDCDNARARLAALPWVADARVRRVFPGEIQVDITERKPFAVWQNDGRLMLVDETGFAIVPVSPSDLTHYPHVVGAGAAANASALIAELKAFPEIESRVRAAVRVGDRRWDLQLTNGIAIELPEDGIAGALGEVTRLDREMGVLSSEVEAIDLRFKDRWILKVPPGAGDLKSHPSQAT